MTTPSDQSHLNNASRVFSRRDSLKMAAGALGIAAMGAHSLGFSEPPAAVTTEKPVSDKPWFSISLAQWSLHNALFAGELDHLDFPKVSKETYGIDAVEYVNAFFKQKTKDTYLAELKKRCDDHGVVSVLIMCDGEGALGDADAGKRKQAVQNHHKWVDAALYLGCHSIRVNAQSEGSYEEQMGRAAEGLASLCEYGEKQKINVIVENHGGLSSNGAWLAGVMKRVNHPRVGTLPDFGNFNISSTEKYDIYKGTAELMPFAKGVSAKSHDFDDRGEETAKDYTRLLKIVKDAGYRGHIGIEYEGTKISEKAGILATKRLLERVRG
jgi:L-ribulose-5-phosphate 3-epimerase